jgi:hypothetical protein
MIGAWVAGSVASAAEGHVDVLGGMRTAPDAALEQPAEWEPEFEPSAVGAVVARVHSNGGEAWWGLDGEVWGMVPEPDATLLALGPRAGTGATVGDTRLEVAGRVDGELYPYVNDATNLRAEGLGSTTLRLGNVRPGLTVEGLARAYPNERTWSFRTVMATASVDVASTSERVRGGLSGDWQLNAGREPDGSGWVPGQQARGMAEFEVSGRHLEGWASYQLIYAWNGAADDAARSQFTPLGAYSSDADALSAGGFLQHKVEFGGSAEAGEWTVRASALGRWRDTEDPVAASYARTLHGQVDVQRDLSERLAVFGTLGTSAAEVVSGKGFTDVYVWLGLSFALGAEEARY